MGLGKNRVCLAMIVIKRAGKGSYLFWNETDVTARRRHRTFKCQTVLKLDSDHHRRIRGAVISRRIGWGRHPEKPGLR